MANPVGKHTRHRTGQRRARNWRLKTESQSNCSNCAALIPPHTVCTQCGFYGGKLIVAKKVRKSKKKKQEGESGEEKA
jgi:large subunit ribosomal protein L32